MSFKIFHQMGFRYNWNFDSFKDDNVGDGFILAPRYMDKTSIEDLSNSIKKKSIFDPQFFLPNTVKGKLESYSFFPELASSGFDSEDYSESYADEVADKCISFQLENDFSNILIPTRYFEGSPTDFIEKQEKFSINSFLKILKNKEHSKKIILQLILNDLMFKDSEYISDILNWLTSFSEIDGIYLITQINSSSKQIKDVDYLLALFDFIDVLKLNDLEVYLGYLNTESIILSLTNPDIITIGSYENLRSFSLRNFMILENGRQSAPNPRLYVSSLLQWLEHPYIGAIKRVVPNYAELFDENKYQAEMFEPSFNWHFNRPHLYKHYFVVFYEQMKYISSVQGSERYTVVAELLKGAIKQFSILNEKGIAFDYNSDGSHLSLWLTVANIFAEKKGWK